MIPSFSKRSFELIFAVAFALLFSACKPGTTAVKTPESIPEPKSSPEFVIQAEDYIESSEGLIRSEDGTSVVTNSDTKDWLTYELKVAQSGRYKVTVVADKLASGAASFWVEDFIDNKDDRTYNITGTMKLAANDGESQTVSKDGSPLKAGTHKIRVHKEGAKLNLDAIRFSMIRPHTDTPKIQEQNMEGKTWKLTWADEFEGTGLPDGTKWTYDVGDWGWGNNELQYYTVERTENARMEDGNLIIQARKNDAGNAWTSARLTTRGKVSFLYGKIEFRAKVPPNKGSWAAGWTLGDEYRDESSWPYCGEIDILESVGFEMNDETGDGEAHASVHCGAYYFKLGNQPTAVVPVKSMYQEFHTYSVVWTPEKMTAYVDDKAYFEYDDTRSELAWPFNKPQNLILNLAMGGGWGGAQGMDESITEQNFIIDYVRVYELE